MKNKIISKIDDGDRLFFFSLIFLTLFLVDLEVRFFGKMGLILVEKDSISVVFAALCTIASLGSAVLSIVISAFSTRIFGFSIKDILSLSGSKPDISSTVKQSFCIILIAIATYILSLYTTTTFLLITVTLIILQSSVELWYLLVNEEHAATYLVDLLTASKDAKHSKYLKQLYMGLEETLETKDILVLERYVLGIEVVYSKTQLIDDQASVILLQCIKHIFPKACLNFGFVDAYRWIVNFGSDFNKLDIDSSTAVSSYFDKLLYCDERSIGDFSLQKNIDDILQRLNIDKDDKERLVFYYFENLIKNKIISRDIKFDQLRTSIDYLTSRFDDNFGVSRANLIVYIYKCYVVENDDKDFREFVHSTIINGLAVNNRYNRTRTYISAVAEIFRMLYFYSKYEKETIVQKHRKELESLFSYKRTTITAYSTCLFELLHVNSVDILNWLIRDTENAYLNESTNRTFEFFPYNYISKALVWSRANLLKFSFLFYCIEWQHFNHYPINIISDTNKGNKEISEFMIRDVLYFFDISSDSEFIQLKDFIKNEMSDMQYCLNTGGVIPTREVIRNYEFFNKTLDQIIQSDDKQTKLPTNQEIQESNKLLIRKLNEMKFFVLDESKDLTGAIVLKIAPSIIKREKVTAERLAEESKAEIISYCNEFLARTIPKFRVEFNITGVRSMLQILKRDNFVFRNYTYYDDWGLSEDIRVSEDYRCLKEIIDLIDFKYYQELNGAYFLTRNRVVLNASVEFEPFRAPFKKECMEYLQYYKVAEGKYQIDGVVRNLEKSIDFIIKTHVLVSSTIKVITDINLNMGIKIEFK